MTISFLKPLKGGAVVDAETAALSHWLATKADAALTDDEARLWHVLRRMDLSSIRLMAALIIAPRLVDEVIAYMKEHSGDLDGAA